LSSLVFGYLVERYGNYDRPFIPMATLLLIGCCLWLKVDPRRRLITERHAVVAAAVPSTAE
jgi:hypothetical protein